MSVYALVNDLRVQTGNLISLLLSGDNTSKCISCGKEVKYDSSTISQSNLRLIDICCSLGCAKSSGWYDKDVIPDPP